MQPELQPPPMGRLDAGWRSDYITEATSAERAQRLDGVDVTAAERCVFCAILAEGPTERSHLVDVADHAFCVLNAYPYSTGHVLILPTRHVASFEELSADEYRELFELVRTATEAVSAAYRPDGMNVGINLGRAAGAGIPGHLHVHVVPRWNGDTNFMTAIGETRVMPESLERTKARVAAAWPSARPSA